MVAPVQGLHHVTAISGPAPRTHAFWRDALGLRFVKRTVNFDDPETYHLYYGTELGAPDTAMTFFPYEHARRGVVGAGQAAVTGFAVPRGALGFWRTRLPQFGAAPIQSDSFGEARADFADPDGLRFALIETDDPREPWDEADVPQEAAIRGFHSVTLWLHKAEATGAILTGALGYVREEETKAVSGRLIRYRAGQGNSAAIVDILEDSALPVGRSGAGTVHHIAFRVDDKQMQDATRAALIAQGLDVTERIDRNYFHSIYTRTPGGVLFEVATDEPGFTVDEPQASLGEALKLPARYEAHRAQIEQALPAL